MTEKEVIREILDIRGWSQQKLADEAGFKRQSNVGTLLKADTKGMRVDNLVKLIEAMGCELVVRDKMGTKKEWVINNTPAPVLTIEEQLQAGKITFDEAISKGWRPSPEMLTKMLG